MYLFDTESVKTQTQMNCVIIEKNYLFIKKYINNNKESAVLLIIIFRCYAEAYLFNWNNNRTNVFNIWIFLFLSFSLFFVCPIFVLLAYLSLINSYEFDLFIYSLCIGVISSKIMSLNSLYLKTKNKYNKGNNCEMSKKKIMPF